MTEKKDFAMVYQRHSVWEDEDKWDIHKSDYKESKYRNDSKEEKEQPYRNEQQYGGNKSKEDGLKSDYIRKEDEKKEEVKKDQLTETIEQEGKYKNNKDVDEDHLQKKAAEEISQEMKEQPKKDERKKNIRTIEDAINKAVKEEKEVFVLDK